MPFFASINTFTELEAGAPSKKVDEVDTALLPGPDWS
jgi:hypothetical protein